MTAPLPVSLAGRDLLRISDLVPAEAEAILDRAVELRAEPKQPLLQGATLGLYFAKHSTRTRVSFSAGIAQLGGVAIPLTPDELQLSRGESLHDTARALSGYLDVLAVRTHAHEELEAWAEHASIPVINALTALEHPCQALADALTIRDRLGTLDGVRVAWVGDGSNVLTSLAALGELLGYEVVAACPPGYESTSLLRRHRRDPREAVAGADVVVTDTWISMGQEHERAQRLQRPRALPARRRAARARLARRVRHALPARAPGRGDHRRRALREPVGDLGRGREPAARPEGAPHAAARRVDRTNGVSATSAATIAKPMRPSPGSENVSPSSGVPTRIVTAAIRLTKPIAAPGASGRTRAAPANAGANGSPAASPTTTAPATASANGDATASAAGPDGRGEEARAHEPGPADQAPAERPRDRRRGRGSSAAGDAGGVAPTRRPRGAAASRSSSRARPRARTMRRASPRAAAAGGRDRRPLTHARRSRRVTRRDQQRARADRGDERGRDERRPPVRPQREQRDRRARRPPCSTAPKSPSRPASRSSRRT